MDKDLVIKKTAEFVKKSLENEASGHDYWHAYRVWKLAKKISKKENADNFIVELAALLHDISDWKFSTNMSKTGGEIAKKFLNQFKINNDELNKIAFIIDNLSYKGGTNKIKMQTLEGKIVQDADRLDAIGAIGIARAFTFGGFFNAKMYDPKIKPMKFKNFEHYKKSMKENTVINHFHEKLLLLKDIMNTDTARKMAIEKHKYMEEYLKNFYKEWEGKE